MAVDRDADIAGHAETHPVFTNVFAHGAKGDGTTDDTTALQSAIDACPQGGTVLLPVGTYKITSALNVTDHVAIRGAGIASLIGAAATSDNGSGPLTSPYLSGSVIVPSTAGQNGIEITGAGLTVNLFDFGIKFADAIMCTDTGHGIECANPTVVSVGHELSTYNSLWQNVSVFGHDGDHYAFYVRNSLMGTYAHLRSYGGGGIYMEGEHDVCVCGNAVILHPYVWLFCGGTADSYHLKSQRQGLNLIQALRPQTIITSVPGALSSLGITAPSVAQYMWNHDGSDIDRISVYDPDFEGPTYSNPVDFGGSGANTIVRPGGIILGPSVTTVPFATQRQGIDVDTGLTVSPGTGAGTGGTSTTPFGARDHGCRVRIVAGSSPGVAGTKICTVTYGISGPRDTVVLQPAETSATAALGLFTNNLSDNGFDVYARTQLVASTTYDFHFVALKAYE